MLTFALAGALAPFAPAIPVAEEQSAATGLVAYSKRVGTSLTAFAELEGPAGADFQLFVSPQHEGAFDPQSAKLVAQGVLDAWGHATVAHAISHPAQAVAAGSVPVRAVISDGVGRREQFDDAFYFGIAANCLELDFDHAPGGVSPTAGRIIDDEWSDMGMTVSATNANGEHPDLAVIFDSANPTGADADLATPGVGPGNDTALGKLLVIPEAGMDDGGGFLDAPPDDEAFGGTIRFDFQEAITICSVTLVDMDDAGTSELRFWEEGAVAPSNVIPVVNVGDNGVQTIHFLEQGIVRMDVFFAGSGAIGGLELEPCPILLNFDETPTGIPFPLAVGEVITDQYAFIGVNISGVNNGGGPNKVILFDTENPTGGDDDLATPGTGAGNDTPLGKVLIIPENDIDVNNDTFVDDPNDEAGGGLINFTFDDDIVFITAKILDIDGGEDDFLELFDEFDQLIDTLPIPILGDNSVFTIEPAMPIENVRRIQLTLGGSGAITRLRWCPDHDDEPLPDPQ